MNALLQLVPEAERDTVESKAQRVAAGNQGWARALLGPVGGRYGEKLAIAVTAIAPALPVRKLQLLTRYSLWTFLLDNRVEDSKASPAALRALEDGITCVTNGTLPPGTDDPLLITLAELLAKLRRHDTEGVLFASMLDGLRDATSAGVAQTLLTRAIDQGEEPPCAEDYLELASRHINYRSFIAALLILVGGATPEPRQQLDDAMSAASRAVRLANDLGSLDRDRQEGSLNTLLLRTRDGSPVTPEAIQDQIAQHVQAHDKLVGTLAGPNSDSTAKALINSLRVSVGVYYIDDLR